MTMMIGKIIHKTSSIKFVVKPYQTLSLLEKLPKWHMLVHDEKDSPFFLVSSSSLPTNVELYEPIKQTLLCGRQHAKQQNVEHYIHLPKHVGPRRRMKTSFLVPRYHSQNVENESYYVLQAWRTVYQSFPGSHSIDDDTACRENDVMLYRFTSKNKNTNDSIDVLCFNFSTKCPLRDFTLRHQQRWLIVHTRFYIYREVFYSTCFWLIDLLACLFYLIISLKIGFQIKLMPIFKCLIM